MHSGTGPELYHVVFELSEDGSTWAPLGAATRIPGGWQLTGLSPFFNRNLWIRARGVAIGGYQTASQGIVEFVQIFYNRGGFLNVMKQGVGSGTVTSTPPGIDCGSDCRAPFSRDMPVALIATPDAAFAFSGWMGACSGTGPCIVTINDNILVYAVFAIKGDVDGDGAVTLSDAIMALRVSSIMFIPAFEVADVDGDGKVGLAEAIWILQKIAEMRSN